jgi:hypothetical protein
MSKYLEELIETAGDVEKLEKALGELESQRNAARAEVVKLKAEAQSKTEAPKNENVGTEQTAPKRGSWW